jgi:RNA polymerase sigma-70 factor (ECF subfamily)
MQTPPTAQVERLYRQYGAMVHRRCRRILRDEEEALDATQDVFARAIRYWDTWDGKAERINWLNRIATNHCLNRIRDSKGRREKLEQRKGERPAVGTGPASHRELEQLDLVHAVMRDMPEDLQRLAILYWFDEMTQAEIATEVGLSVPTVRKRLRQFIHEARRALKVGFESSILRAIAADPVKLLLFGASASHLFPIPLL